MITPPVRGLVPSSSRAGVVDTSRSIPLADWVGACAATLQPLIALIRTHVMSGARLHGDDTTVPVLAKTRTTTGRLWTYVRDDPLDGRW
jgi:hypothetical protein